MGRVPWSPKALEVGASAIFRRTDRNIQHDKEGGEATRQKWHAACLGG